MSLDVGLLVCREPPWTGPLPPAMGLDVGVPRSLRRSGPRRRLSLGRAAAAGPWASTSGSSVECSRPTCAPPRRGAHARSPAQQTAAARNLPSSALICKQRMRCSRRAGCGSACGTPQRRSPRSSETRICAGSSSPGRRRSSVTGPYSSRCPSTPTTSEASGGRPRLPRSTRARALCSRRSPACSATATRASACCFVTNLSAHRARQCGRGSRVFADAAPLVVYVLAIAVDDRDDAVPLGAGSAHADACPDARGADGRERSLERVESLAFFVGPALAGLLLAVASTGSSSPSPRPARRPVGPLPRPHPDRREPEAPRRELEASTIAAE